MADFMAQISQQYAEAKRANEMRYGQAMSIYDEIIKRYQPGGGFGKAALGLLEKQKTRDVGGQTQQMISSGLYGTTTTAGLPSKWEAEVGAPSRLRLEDIMMERLSQAQVGKAGFIERREDEYPDVGAAAGYAGQMAQAQATRYGAEMASETAASQRESEEKMQKAQYEQETAMQQREDWQAHQAQQRQARQTSYGQPPQVQKPQVQPDKVTSDQSAYQQWMQTGLAGIEKRYAGYRGAGGEIVGQGGGMTASRLQSGYAYSKAMQTGVSFEQWKKRTQG